MRRLAGLGETDDLPLVRRGSEEAVRRLAERAATASGWESVPGVATRVKVYDDGDKSFDRYTVVLDEPGTRAGGDFAALGLSDNPGHPQGFSQFTTAHDGPHLGKRIKFSDLPDGVRKHAAARLGPEESRGGRRLAGLNERAASPVGKKVRVAAGHGVGGARGHEGEVVGQKGDQLRVVMSSGPEKGVEFWLRPDEVEFSSDGQDEGLSERSALSGEDLDHAIEQEIGRWLEGGAEFELSDINDEIRAGTLAERSTLVANINHIIERELEKKVGKLAPRTVEVAGVDRSTVWSKEDDADGYRALGTFRIWHAGDSYAEGSFAADGMAGELQNMTINVTQASGHRKTNPPIKFFG